MAAPTALDATMFREYDVRGIVGRTLTEDAIRLIGQAFGTLVGEAGGRTVAVGFDGRLSSPALAAALVQGLVSAGIAVKRIGLGPSPMLYFATEHLGTDGGMMVTGSHNPPEYNGIKMVHAGRPFFGDQILSLRTRIGEGRLNERPGGSAESVDVRAAYVARLAEGLDGRGVEGSARRLRVAWDPGNGAAGAVLGMLCERLGGGHIVINGQVDGTFPAHHPDPTVEANLAELKETVARHRCDLGIAFDGDGDRIGVIDGRGRVIWGDQLLVMLSADVLADVPGATIIADVKSSQVFFDEVTRLGGKAVMSRTGHSLIKEKMLETGAALAGEMSGHIFFAHRYYGFDDALYAAVRLLSVLQRSPVGLDAMRDRLPRMVNTPEIRIDCPEERKFAVIGEVRRRLAGIDGLRVCDIDGVRVNTPDGWWLLRASNTQPVLVGRCEAADAGGLDRLKAILAEQLTASGIDAGAVEAS
jgi:phosphomannomutase